MPVAWFAGWQWPRHPPPTCPQLVRERDQLYEAYRVNSQQKSSFWGTQSKADLRRVVDVLRAIVAKDSEIVEAVRVQGVRTQSSYLGQNREVTDRVYTLNAEVEQLNAQLKRSRQQLTDVQTVAAEAGSSRGLQAYAALATVLAAAGWWRARR